MDDLLVEFCRSGKLGPLVLGMNPNDVVERIGQPERIRNGQGDDCFQRYRYSSVELTMRCFSRKSGIRRGAGLDLALAGIRIDVSGDALLILPEMITQKPVRPAASLRLADARSCLAERGVDMSLDREQMLTRTLDEAIVHVVSDAAGFVLELSVGWLPRPGGWYYSEENEAGVWVTGHP
ncbi:hypothetical protein [Saccharopolyspora sp. NPDC002376]